MRWSIVALTFVIVPGRVAAADKTAIELRSDLAVGGIPLAESDGRIYTVRLTANVDKNGDGSGTLELDSNEPRYDEFGFLRIDATRPLIKLECTIKFVKRTKLMM